MNGGELEKVGYKSKRPEWMGNTPLRFVLCVLGHSRGTLGCFLIRGELQKQNTILRNVGATACHTTVLRRLVGTWGRTGRSTLPLFGTRQTGNLTAPACHFWFSGTASAWDFGVISQEG